ncbi:hypothetical protein AB7M46_005724 [Bradyrhizobium elkanii]
MRAAYSYAGAMGIVVFLSLAIFSSPTSAQNVCAQLQQSIDTLRSSGGAGSEWGARAIQQLREYGCYGDSSPQQPQIPAGSVRCGTGYCQAGTKCSRNGECIASDAVDCGSLACPAGNKCTRNGCLPMGAVSCGSGYCNAGSSCVNNQCVQPQSSNSSWLMKLFGAEGSYLSSFAPKITGDQPLSSAIQQRNVQTLPTPYGTEKLYNDPYAGKPMPASQLPQPSADLFGTHPIATQSPWQSTVKPAAPAAQTGQQQPTVKPTAPSSQTGQLQSTAPSVQQPTVVPENPCGAGHRTLRRGSFEYCEIWMPKPE